MKAPMPLVCLVTAVLALFGLSATPVLAATLDPATVNVTWDDRDNAEGIRASFDITVLANTAGESMPVDTFVAGTNDASYTTSAAVEADSYAVKAVAPVGYVTTVTKDSTAPGGNVFTVVATITSTTIECVASDGTPVTGATFTLSTPEGDNARTVVSDNGEIVVYGLIPGFDYVLHQVSSPGGFALADDVEFTTSASEARTSVSVTIPVAGAAPGSADDGSAGVEVAASSSVVQGAASSATQIPATGDTSMLAVALAAGASVCCLLASVALRRNVG